MTGSEQTTTASPAQAAATTTPERPAAVACPTCGAVAVPMGETALLGGTAIVALQRYRCTRTHSHWWDQSTLVIADVSAT